MEDREKEIAAQLAGRYELVELLGRGGFAEVYRVVNVRLHRTEALKILSEKLTDEQDFARRFEQEARVAASLDHPNIVKIYDFGGLDGLFWFSMQLVDGPSLGRRMKSGSRVEPFTAARIGIRVLDALRYSHERGVIHRDIKPDNILIDREGRPYITDFGVAKSQLALVKTQAGMLLGSPAYMSPEQLQGKTLDGRSDLYSVGVTLYKALAGELPFSGEDTFKATIKRLSERPRALSEALPGIDPQLEAIVMHALERDPADRFSDASEFCAALEDFLAGAPIVDQPLLIPAGDDATLVMTPSRGSRTGSTRTPTLARKPSGARPWSSLTPTSSVPIEKTETSPAPPPGSAIPAPASIGLRDSRTRIAVAAVAVAALALGVILLLPRRRATAPEETSAAVPTISQPAAAPGTAATETEPPPVTSIPAVAPTPEPSEAEAAPPEPKSAREERAEPRRAAPQPSSARKTAVPAQASVFPARAARFMPEVEQSVPVDLPESIRAQHRGERVGLSVTVGEDGSVKRATVISEVCPECDRAALDAIKRYHFKPARDGENRPVEATFAIPLPL
jgi:TonB family protein